MSSIKPILFNTDMVQSIIAGFKTVTRRAIKLKYDNTHIEDRSDSMGVSIIEIQNDEEGITKIGGIQKVFGFRYVNPPYQKGDILYIRETWWEDRFYRFRGKENPQYYYRADGETITIGREVFLAPKWKPSIHMPKEAARIFLRVTNVSVAKLQDIDARGIRAEGLSSMAVHCGDMEIAKQEFAILWDSTITKDAMKKYSWEANPWVWVIEFEKKEHKNEQ